MQPDRRERNDKDSPMRRDSTRPVLPSRKVFLAFGLVTLAVAWPQFARAQDAKVAPHETAAPIDPVEDLQQALAIRLEDLTDPKETVLNFRRDTLKRKIARLRRIGDLRRALALEDWKPMDTPQRKEVADLFTERVNRIIAKGDSTARMAVANLIAEIGPQIRAIDPNDKAGFARSLTTQVIELTKDSSPEVQQEALRALGNINPLPRDAFDALKGALRHDRLAARRQAAAALGQLVRVVGFLQKRGRTAAGIESERKDVIEVSLAASAGASYGLADPDPQVRKLCLEAIDEAARATADMIPDPHPRRDFPPEGRPLTDEERKELEFGPAGAASLMRELKELEGIFKAFQAEMPLIARNLGDANTGVALEAARALEDIGIVRVRLFRRVLSAPTVTKAEEVERRKALQGVDPLGYFLTGNRLDEVARLVHAPLAEQRRMAVEVLELLGEDAVPALPAIAEALCDTDRNVQWSAARAIGNIAPRRAPFAVAGLAKLLLHIDDNLRLAAAATLEAMGPDAKEAMPAIVKAIGSGDAETRAASMYILVSVGADNARPAVQALIESLSDHDPRVRRAAADVLGKIAPVSADAVPALRRALEDDDQEVRMHASEALLAILEP
jgi:HEAT repeat protein